MDVLNAAAERTSSRSPSRGAGQRRGPGGPLQRDAADHPQGPQRSVRPRLLQRIHGGAVLASGIANFGYEARRKIATEEKRRIGRKAAALDPRQLLAVHQYRHHDRGGRGRPAGQAGLMVITNNINVANILQGYEHDRGGHRRRRRAAFRRRRRRRGGGRFHPPVQGRLRRHRRLGDRRGRRAARLRLSRGEGGAGDHRMRAPVILVADARSSSAPRRCASAISRRSTTSSPTQPRRAAARDLPRQRGADRDRGRCLIFRKSATIFVSGKRTQANACSAGDRPHWMRQT